MVRYYISTVIKKNEVSIKNETLLQFASCLSFSPYIIHHYSMPLVEMLLIDVHH